MKVLLIVFVFVFSHAAFAETSPANSFELSGHRIQKITGEGILHAEEDTIQVTGQYEGFGAMSPSGMVAKKSVKIPLNSKCLPLAISAMGDHSKVFHVSYSGEVTDSGSEVTVDKEKTSLVSCSIRSK